MGRWAILACLVMLTVGPVRAADAAQPVVIVLIGGDQPHNPNVHDAARGVARLGAALAASPDLKRRGLVVRSYPRGWPEDPDALAGAAAIVCYFDGLDHHPLLDPRRRATFAALMARGVGLVMLHQAATLPADAHDIPLRDWLGAVRLGMVDRTVERVGLTPARHPITRGVRLFAYRDEFYPSLSFAPTAVPIATADLHLEASPTLPATRRTVAWAHERPDGGRSFGYSGVHYLDTLDRPDLRKLLLNAIVWTARLKVPAGGVRSTVTWRTEGGR